MRDSSETHRELQSREVSLARNLYYSFPIILRFFLQDEHDSDTVVLLATFQNDWTIETDVMDEQVILYCTAPRSCWTDHFIIPVIHRDKISWYISVSQNVYAISNTITSHYITRCYLITSQWAALKK